MMILAIPFIAVAIGLLLALRLTAWLVRNWWIFALILLVGFLAGCTDNRYIEVATPRPQIPVSLRTCAAEPAAPDPDSPKTTQKAVDIYDEAVRAAGADCRKNLKAVVTIVEGTAK